jgi:hypothetical protein
MCVKHIQMPERGHEELAMTEGRTSIVLDEHLVAEASEQTREEAARITFDLRRKGRVIRSGIDCLIAQAVMEHERLLLHSEANFELIATVRPLRHERLDITAATPQRK